MAAIDYPSVALRVQTAIEDNGADVVFIRRSETPVDAAKPWRKSSTDLDGASGTAGSTATGKAVRDEYTIEEKAENLNIRAGDFKVIVSPLSLSSVDLKSFQSLELDGEVYRIEEIDIVKPAAVLMLYIIRARR